MSWTCSEIISKRTAWDSNSSIEWNWMWWWLFSNFPCMYQNNELYVLLEQSCYYRLFTGWVTIISKCKQPWMLTEHPIFSMLVVGSLSIALFFFSCHPVVLWFHFNFYIRLFSFILERSTIFLSWWNINPSCPWFKKLTRISSGQ